MTKDYCASCGAYGTLIEWMCPDCFDEWTKENEIHQEETV